jgi:hypothetical protein
MHTEFLLEILIDTDRLENPDTVVKTTLKWMLQKENRGDCELDLCGLQ